MIQHAKTPNVTLTVPPRVPPFEQFHADGPILARPVEKKGNARRPAAGADDDAILAQNLLAPMLALGKFASLLTGGLAPVPQVPVVAPPPTLVVPNPPADTLVEDMSFDGIPPFPSIEDFLTNLHHQSQGKRDLLRFIPLLEEQGFVLIDDLLHVQNAVEIFEKAFDMKMGTTTYIMHHCAKEVKRIKNQYQLRG